jgi:hypothetical protein
MSKFTTLLASLLLALALSLTVARAQTAPTTSSAAPEEMVDNPHYLTWAKHKPGTEVQLDLKTDIAGQQMVTNITQKLVEVSPEQAVVESVATMNIPGLPTKPQTQKHIFAAKVAKSEAEKVNLPPGGEGETKDLGTEKVEAGGKTYECKVSEFTGKVQGSDAKGKQWRTTEIPGGLVKMDSASGGMKIHIEAKKVTEGK